MPHMDISNPPFDLVVLDLDGTILDLYRHSDITPRVRETIARVQDAGIPVTIGTGRTLDYVRGYIGPLGITTPVITTQGAVIGDPVTGRSAGRAAHAAGRRAQTRRLDRRAQTRQRLLLPGR